LIGDRAGLNSPRYFSGEIWSVSAGGGDERQVSGMPRLPQQWDCEWAAASPGIYFVEGGPPPGIDFLDFATARTRRVAVIPGRPQPWRGGLGLSRDGRALLYSQIDGIAGDIMLIENFP
jgi:hypothetical protein